MSDSTLETAWARLERLAAAPGAEEIRPLFAADPGRFAAFSQRGAGLLLDRSKTSVSPEVQAALLDLAVAADVEGKREVMASGGIANPTEGRAALHMALRSQLPGAPAECADAQATLARMREFTATVHRGEIRGATNQRFDTVLNIGIGGSDLGPVMVGRALWRAGDPMRPIHLGNVDGHGWETVLPLLDARRTLVLVASKTFTTQETMANARLVKQWMEASVGPAGASAHFAALSTNMKDTAAFGIAPDRVFPFQDWVGGRFSLWSSIGLSLALSLGWDRFQALLDGAAAMDRHFLEAPMEENLPILLALTEIWHINGLGLRRRAVLPYDERLRRLPAHLQQLEMESLGKRVTVAGMPVRRSTGAVVFGEPGTSAQHSFMQLVHQGAKPVPVDFILVAKPDHTHAENHRILLANGLAQAEALLAGRNAEEVAEDMRRAGADEATIARLVPHKVFPGDRPSVTILLPRLDPFTLGALIALYEHKVFTLGALWGINPFDQWGVELGKVLANPLVRELEAGARGPTGEGGHDASTAGLLAEVLRLQAQP
ncbi:glucose-6-phosphate isomerase [Roseococcus sp. SYP-B2431]|uniref:glucose-6-phosphate isomerase n=1 Tax=Roseococcus sp. SYP-B2431 TaxID=2496640 RepID=UPI00103D442B|nr:glucose-6-phosphate isomerase [Roseococcus sp. SYP-B2431]TCI00503.1 glucose-6-phosphate isomerase [Roseococcus sp. SYP-B2431]